MKIHKIWNGKILGLPKALHTCLISCTLYVLDKISTFFWKFNLNTLGKDAVIQSFVTIRNPGNVAVGGGVNVGRFARLTTEFCDSRLEIGAQSLIGKSSSLDFSGDLLIGANVVISEGASIYTHSHGLDPKSVPVKKPLIIYDDVWVGTRAIILESVSHIGKGSVVAAGAVVSKDVAPNTLVGGVPARVIGHIPN